MSLEKENELLKLKIEILMKIAKFYGDRENWVFSYHINGAINYREIINTDTYSFAHPENKNGQYYGGKTARTGLKLIEEINKGNFP